MSQLDSHIQEILDLDLEIAPAFVHYDTKQLQEKQGLDFSSDGVCFNSNRSYKKHSRRD